MIKIFAVSKETELLKKYWNHVSKKASRHVLGLCKNYFLCFFYLCSTSEWFSLPRTVPVHSSLPITPLQPHQMLYCGQGLVKLSKVQKMWCLCPGSAPLQTAHPHWGAAREEEGFCRADGENEAGEQREAANRKMWQHHSQVCLGKCVLRDLGWPGSGPVEGKELV